MKYILTIITLFTAILIADTTANIGLTLIDSDVSFSGKVKHIIDRGKWTSNFDTTYTYKTSDGKEKTNDLYFQYKEQYELTEKSYALGIAQFDYDKFRKDYDLRTVLGAGYGYKFIDTETWKLSNETSFAYLQSSGNELIVRNNLGVSYNFSEKLSITNNLLFESGKDMYLRNATSLMYKLSDKISVGLNNTYTDNVTSKNIFTINLGVKL